MICPKCQHRNQFDAAFCDECAAPLDGTCPSCLASNRRGAKFCRLCAYPILGVPAEEALVPARPLVADVADRREDAAVDPPDTEGERKQLTVLFADIKGSMELIAFRDPEDARRILDPVVGAMMTAVRSYGGTVNRVMGDGLMALFGAPTALEDHALCACQAALRIQELVRRLITDGRVSADVDVKVRVGLNSGEVVFHHIQTERQVEYSATGHAVHLAARMEQLAQPGTILISESTFRACSGMLDATPLGAVTIKGLPQPQPVFELNSVRSRELRLAIAGQAGTLSRFVDREAQRAALERAANHALDGKGQVVALVGEPGVGKSRLAFDFCNSSAAAPFLRLEARALSYGSRSAFMPIVALLRSYMGVERGDPGGETTRRVSRKLSDLQADPEATLPALLWLLGVTGYSESWDALDPQLKRERTLAALRRLILAQSEAKPLLILFEDLHWIDTETQAVLDVLAAAIADAPVLLVVTHREEYLHDWSERSYYSRIAVRPLERSVTHEFLDNLVGHDPSLAALKDTLAARTEGNALFLEESVRALVETGAIIGAGESYRVGTAGTEVDIAPSIQAVLAARIDRLPSRDKRLLQAASVIGQDVPFDILKEVVDMNPAELDQGLKRLTSANFIGNSTVLTSTHTFRHALTHDVAYASLLRERRKVIHGKALLAVERIAAAHPAEHLEALGRHALRNENWEKAVRYLRQAGNAAAVRSAFKEAETWYRSAIDAWTHLPESRARTELGVDLRIDLYAAVLTYGDINPVFEVLEEAQALAEALGDEIRLSSVSGYLSMAYWWIADYPKALDTGMRALSLAQSAGRQGVELWIALMTLAWTESALGNFEAAKQHLKELLSLVRSGSSHSYVRNGLPSSRVMALCWVTLCCADTGDFEEGLEAAHQAVSLAERIDQPWSRAAAYYALGSTLVRSGDLSQATAVLEKGQQLCTEYLIPGWATTIDWILGYAYALNGEPKRGVAILEQVVRKSTADRCHTRLSLRIANLAEAELMAGNEARASDLGRQALHLAETYGERPAEGQVRRLLGDIALQVASDKALASSHYERALAIAREFSMRPLEAECGDRLARISTSVDDSPKAPTVTRG